MRVGWGGRFRGGHLRAPRPTLTRRTILSHSPDGGRRSRSTNHANPPPLAGRAGWGLSRSDSAARRRARLRRRALALLGGRLLRAVGRGGLPARLRRRLPEGFEIVVGALARKEHVHDHAGIVQDDPGPIVVAGGA